MRPKIIMAGSVMAIPKKPRKCRHCKQMFQPTYCGQNTCSFECQVALGVFFAERSKAKREKAERIAEIASTKILREKLKTKRDWMREAQAAINSYVRVRDSELGCISCDKPSSWNGQWHASHFKSTGANSFLRFNLWNIHKACSVCNNHLSGNIGEYSKRLPEKIGNERFEYLDTAPKIGKYSVEYLKRLRDIFRKKTRILMRRRGLL